MQRSLFLTIAASAVLAVSCAPAAKPQGDFKAQLVATAAASPHAVEIDRELMILDVSVVDDARAKTGAWSFGALMTQMAPNDAAAPAFIKAWLQTWEQDPPINGLPLDKRAAIRNVIINPWMAKDGATSFAQWKPNPKNAPFRLLGIAYRPDLVRRAADGTVLNAGEGRFIFEAVDANGNSLQFTVILEYGLVAKNNGEITAWAQKWHALGAIPFGANYNAELQKITDAFSKRGADPSKPNGNSLNQLRTNEFAIGDPWQLREFHITTNGLTNVVVQQNPHKGVDPAELSALLNANAASVLDGSFVFEEDFASGKPILGGSAEVPFGFFWPQMQITDNNVRQKFAVNTCNGCHHVETGAKPDPGGFRHIGSRQPGQAAGKSLFLVGGTVNDPVSGTPRQFNDLAERKKALEQALVVQVNVTSSVLEANQLTVAKSRQGRVH